MVIKPHVKIYVLTYFVRCQGKFLHLRRCLDETFLRETLQLVVYLDNLLRIPSKINTYGLIQVMLPVVVSVLSIIDT